MTVKQLKEALEEMKQLYPYEDDKTEISAYDLNHLDSVTIKVTDEKSGMTFKIRKDLND